MFISVIKSYKNNIKGLKNDPSFFLEENNWNDFGYYTTYALHLSGKHTDDKQHSMIGFVKILKEDQQVGKTYLKPGFLEELDESFCSLGQSLDYYERLAQLNVDLRKQLFIALRDIVIYPEFNQGFTDEPAYRKSLFREIKKNDDIFDLAPLFMSRDFNKLLSLDLKFEFKIPEIKDPIVFDFDSPTYGFNNRSLPNRIAVIIGRNASGKSTLLSRISRIAFASATDRKNRTLQKIGRIKPEGLGFPRIIVLSYSAFDSFQTPGVFKIEKEIISKEIKEGIGRYVFCGIRDIVRELEDILPKLGECKINCVS